MLKATLYFLVRPQNEAKEDNTHKQMKLYYKQLQRWVQNDCLRIKCQTVQSESRKNCWFLFVLPVCAQLCPTLCNPVDCSPLGSPVSQNGSRKCLSEEVRLVATSLVVQWLRLHAANAAGTGLIPDQGAKTPPAACLKDLKKKKRGQCRAICSTVVESLSCSFIAVFFFVCIIVKYYNNISDLMKYYFFYINNTC